MKFKYRKFNLSPTSDFFGRQIFKPIIPIKILKAEVGFSYDISKNGYGIFGQKGFFDKSIVKFDLVKEEIEIKERI